MPSEWRERLGRQVNDNGGEERSGRGKQKAAEGSGESERRGRRMEDGFSSYSSLYDTSSLLQFCNGKVASTS